MKKWKKVEEKKTKRYLDINRIDRLLCTLPIGETNPNSKREGRRVFGSGETCVVPPPPKKKYQ